MIWLLIVSLIWAFSFGLIKTQLAGLDASFISFVRLLISFLIFLPFLRVKKMSLSLSTRLFFTGMIQYGLMYLSYIYAYNFLAAYEIALFTIFTPLYITLFNDLFSRKFHKLFLIEALIAVIATGIILFNRISNMGLVSGFLLIQISNISFAFGQVYYKRILKNTQYKDRQIFALLYAGAVFLTGISSLLTVDFNALRISMQQVYTLLYLGFIASGAGFFLWNYGARRTDTGTLAVFNNLKIPLAISVSFLFFAETGSIPRLLIGGIILVGLIIYNEKFLKNYNT